MKATATVKFKLIKPIQCSSNELPSLKFPSINCNSILREIELIPKIEDNQIKQFDALCYCEGDKKNFIPVHSITEDFLGFSDLQPELDSWRLLRHILSIIQSITFQVNIVDSTGRLDDILIDILWELEDGTQFKQSQSLSGASVGRPVLEDTLIEPLEEKKWDKILEFVEDNSLPLWRSLLTLALETSKTTNYRATILHTATAIDVYWQQNFSHLRDKRGNNKFDMECLRGCRHNLIDLQTDNPKLYTDISELWFTRHAIIHKGELCIYTTNPQNSNPNSRPFEPETNEFIKKSFRCIPEVISYLENKKASSRS